MIQGTEPVPEPRSRLSAGVVVELADGVRRLVAPNAGLMTGPGTNTYLLGTREIAVMDPGPADVAHLEAILAAAADAIRWIVVTHTHRDHSPLAAVLAERTGAQLIGLPAPGDGRQDETFGPQRLPRDAEQLRLGDIRLTAIHTPGHASNCVCYFLEEQRLLFTGDHVLEGVSPVILPPDGNMSDYLHSLGKLEAYDFETIAPGHGGLIASGKRALEGVRRHRLAREAKVVRALESLQAATLDGLTVAVYDDVPMERHAWAKLTLEAHLIKLEQDGRVSRSQDLWRIGAARHSVA